MVNFMVRKKRAKRAVKNLIPPTPLCVVRTVLLGGGRLSGSLSRLGLISIFFPQLYSVLSIDSCCLVKPEPTNPLFINIHYGTLAKNTCYIIGFW